MYIQGIIFADDCWIRLITTKLGWQLEYTFEQGMAETIEWYLQNPEWVENVTSGEYQKYYEMMYGNR